MADRNRYENRENRDYEREDDRGFFDEVRDWFRTDDSDRVHNREWDPNRQEYRRAERDRDRWYDWDRSRRAGWNRDSGRDSGYNQYQGSDRSRWQDRGQNFRDWDQDWNRSQDRYGSGTQSDWGQHRQTNWDRDEYRDWNQNRGRDWQTDQDRDFGRSTYGSRYGTNYERGWRGDQGYDRDYSGRGWQENRGMRDRWYEDRGQRGQYGTAGMRSDYGGDYDYENEYGRNQQQNRDFERGYDQGYVGYDREGAFYQDLDEPYSYEYWEVWMVPGEFTGLGPSSYHRSDERIHEDVCERLTRHGKIDAREIEIDVKEGEIVLRGSVPTREMKRMAEDVAEGVSGQKDVRNEIRVRKEERHTRTGMQSGTGTGSQGIYGTQPGIGTGSQTMAQAQSAGGNIKKSQLRQGMEVIGKNGKIVGRVKEVRDRDFLVDRDMARDVYVPYDAVDSVGAQAMLEVAADEVDNQNWETPDLL